MRNRRAGYEAPDSVGRKQSEKHSDHIGVNKSCAYVQLFHQAIERNESRTGKREIKYRP